MKKLKNSAFVLSLLLVGQSAFGDYGTGKGKAAAPTKKPAAPTLSPAVQEAINSEFKDLLQFFNNVPSEGKVKQVVGEIKKFQDKDMTLTKEQIMNAIDATMDKNVDRHINLQEKEALGFMVSRELGQGGEPTIKEELEMANTQFKEAVDYWFGQGNQLNFFDGDKIKENELNKAFNHINSSRIAAEVSVRDTLKLIQTTLNKNEQARLDGAQQEALLRQMNFLLSRFESVAGSAEEIKMLGQGEGTKLLGQGEETKLLGYEAPLALTWSEKHTESKQTASNLAIQSVLHQFTRVKEDSLFEDEKVDAYLLGGNQYKIMYKIISENLPNSSYTKESIKNIATDYVKSNKSLRELSRDKILAAFEGMIKQMPE